MSVEEPIVATEHVTAVDDTVAAMPPAVADTAGEDGKVSFLESTYPSSLSTTHTLT